MLTVGALGAGLLLAAAILHVGNSRYPRAPDTERLLYVRDDGTARHLALSFKGLAADLYWIRTIQDFGRDRRLPASADRFALLQPLLDLTTSLDPYFSIAYRYGAIFLGSDEGARRPDEAIALLEKGLKATPDHWQYAYDIGFTAYLWQSDYKTAGLWFTRAADMPGAPEWIRPLAATTLAQGGDRATARSLLTQLASAAQEYLRKDATRGLAQIDALDAIDRLQAIVDDFDRVEHRYPSGWGELIQTGRLPGIPADTTRMPFAYDAATHRVTLGAGSTLAPLPTSLGRR
jgi:tetratricopeptide (TPR) repeat protein